MKVASLFVVVAVLGMPIFGPAASHGQVPSQRRPVFHTCANERGLTLDDLLDGTLLALARQPFTPATLTRIGDSMHQRPGRGVQFELLTPGDIGATLHVRW